MSFGSMSPIKFLKGTSIPHPICLLPSWEVPTIASNFVPLKRYMTVYTVVRKRLSNIEVYSEQT
jgi:hypothetical protein